MTNHHFCLYPPATGQQRFFLPFCLSLARCATRGLFEASVRAALAQANTWSATEEIPQGTYHFVEFLELHEETMYRVRYKKQYEYNDWLYRHARDPFWHQEVVQRYLKKLWEVTGTSPTEGNNGSFSFDDLLADALLVPLVDILERYGTFEPTQEQLKESYSRYHKWWIDGRIHYNITIPLLRFTSDLQHPVQLSPHRHLAPFTIEEKTLEWNQILDLMRWNPMEPPLSIDFRAFCLTSFKLTNSFIEQPGESPESVALALEEEDIITALRLVHSGKVGASAAMGTNRMPPGPPSFIDSPPDPPIGFTGFLLPMAFMQESFYVLSQADLTILQNLCQSLQRLGKQKSGLAVSLRCFNQSYDRKHQEDRIIDLTIALESCLLWDVRDELNYRLALRGAALLAQTKLWSPEQAYSLLKEMYAIRSAIVHTGQELSHLEKNLRNKLQRLMVRLSSHEKETPDIKLPGMQLTMSQMRARMKAHLFPLEEDNFFEVLSEFLDYCEDIVRDILRTYVVRLAKGGSVETVCEDLDQYILHSFTGVSNKDREDGL